AAEQAAIGIPTEYNYFYYPPVFLLICAPLAWLPYLPAFILFQAAGAAACFFALRMIRRDLPLVVFLAFPGLWWAIGTGQNALLTAALFAAGTVLLERRPWLAGLCLGALCYKPHFGLLIPVALIAGGHWRGSLGAAAAVALIWRPRCQAPLPLRAAVLLAATPVAVPVLMFYDLMLVFVALVWLSRVTWVGGAPKWLTGIAIAVFLGPLLSGNLATRSHWLMAFMTASLAFGLTLAIAWRSLALPRWVAARPVTGAV